MNIAINGLGRIGRAALKILVDRLLSGAEKNINIVAINDLSTIENLVYLLKYDSVYGVYNKKVSFENTDLLIENIRIKMFSEKDPSLLPWKDLNVDVVLECTGVFTNSEGSGLHLKAGAKKVIVSAPAKDDKIKTLVLGASDMVFDSNLLSNSSCTTNSIAPVLSVISENFGIEKAMLTTVHAYTASQAIVDGPVAKDFRRGRAAAHNIIPSSTGAAKSAVKATNFLKAENFDGVALRVPVICGSISDLTILVKKDVTVEEINNAFILAKTNPKYSKIIAFAKDPIVSSDIIMSSFSGIVDGSLTRVVGGNLVKIMVWYDNEWGYSNRLVDLATWASNIS